jgi:alkylhydroperoxidase family enzyme
MPKHTFLLLVLTLAIAAAATPAGQRVKPPRIAPLEPSEWTDEIRTILGPRAQGDRTRNTFKICVRNPALCRSWMPFTTYVESGDSTLPPRDRELLILRTAWLCGNDPTWGPHEANARRLGLTDEDVLRITKGPKAPGWSAFDAALLLAADELHADQFIQDGTWKTLSSRYSERQLMDTIFAVGQYTMISMYLNSVGAQLGPGDKPLPK